MCQLTGQEVANASMWDGSTATTEAVLMAERVTGRQRVLVARSLHPEYRDVMKTYARNCGLSIEELPYEKTGMLDAAALQRALKNDVAAVVLQSPNFFGAIENPADLADAVHAAGALLVVAVTEGVSLGLLQPPAEADIVAMESQSFGLPPSYGGPFAGVIASREKFVRQMPGRLAGQTTDSEGRRGFVLTLATREQHIRREKATSNICTNQGLYALMATVYLSLMGRKGVREVAEQNVQKAHYAARQIANLNGYRLRYRAPFFNEFVVTCPQPAQAVVGRLIANDLVAGLPLARFFSDAEKELLVCVTENVTKVEIDALVNGLANI